MQRAHPTGVPCRACDEQRKRKLSIVTSKAGCSLESHHRKADEPAEGSTRQLPVLAKAVRAGRAVLCHELHTTAGSHTTRSKIISVGIANYPSQLASYRLGHKVLHKNTHCPTEQSYEPVDPYSTTLLRASLLLGLLPCRPALLPSTSCPFSLLSARIPPPLRLDPILQWAIGG